MLLVLNTNHTSRICEYSEMSIFSFHPVKMITTEREDALLQIQNI